MAFERDGLQRIGGANSDSLAVWCYASSADAAAAITGTDYFLEAIDVLKVGDCLFIYDSASSVTISFVKTNTGTSIDLASGTAIGDV